MRKISVNLILIIGIMFGTSAGILIYQYRKDVVWDEVQGAYTKEFDFTDIDTMNYIGNTLLNSQGKRLFVNLLDYFELLTMDVAMIVDNLHMIIEPLLSFVNDIISFFNWYMDKIIWFSW